MYIFIFKEDSGRNSTEEEIRQGAYKDGVKMGEVEAVVQILARSAKNFPEKWVLPDPAEACPAAGGNLDSPGTRGKGVCRGSGM